jgi:hypothetical protein
MFHLTALISFSRLKVPRTLAREVVRLFGVLMVCLVLMHPESQTVQAQTVQAQIVQSQSAGLPAVQPPPAPTSQASPSPQPVPDEAAASTQAIAGKLLSINCCHAADQCRLHEKAG